MLIVLHQLKKTKQTLQTLRCICYQHIVNILFARSWEQVLQFFFNIMLSVEECENMSRYDRQDRNSRQHQEGFWKRAPQQRWNTQEHYHLGHADHYIHGKNDLNR